MRSRRTDGGKRWCAKEGARVARLRRAAGAVDGRVLDAGEADRLGRGAEDAGEARAAALHAPDGLLCVRGVALYTSLPGKDASELCSTFSHDPS